MFTVRTREDGRAEVLGWDGAAYVVEHYDTWPEAQRVADSLNAGKGIPEDPTGGRAAVAMVRRGVRASWTARDWATVTAAAVVGAVAMFAAVGL